MMAALLMFWIGGAGEARGDENDSEWVRVSTREGLTRATFVFDGLDRVRATRCESELVIELRGRMPDLSSDLAYDLADAEIYIESVTGGHRILVVLIDRSYLLYQLRSEVTKGTRRTLFLDLAPSGKGDLSIPLDAVRIRELACDRPVRKPVPDVPGTPGIR